MREIKLLFTSVGRRVELLQAFRHAGDKLGLRLKIYGAEMSNSAPALAFCDGSIQVCSIRSDEYIPQLLDICRSYAIDVLIPTIDTDLLILSRNRERFSAIGTRVLISAPEMIAVCRDKNKTGAFFEGCGLMAPGTYSDYEKYNGPFPCFIKPKDGSSSIDAYKVGTAGDLPVYAKMVKDYIIQPFIAGKEYTVDILCDFEGEPVYITPRERIAVRSGEVIKTKIAQDARIVEECLRLIAAFKPCGPLTVQLIRQNETGDDYFIEINPRFGGGAPLSMMAGADSAEAILRQQMGEKLSYTPAAAEDGAVYSRFDQSVRIVS